LMPVNWATSTQLPPLPLRLVFFQSVIWVM
jgi:hypothetical protein